MRCIILALCVILTGCVEEWWYVESVPAEVVITDERLEPFLDTIQKAVDGYNSQFTTPIFHLKVDYSAKKTCGRIYVMIEEDDNTGGEAHSVKECMQYHKISSHVLKASPDGLRLTIQHELGHALGMVHDDDINSVMSAANDHSLWDAKNKVWLQHLTEENLQEIADRYGVELKK